jgi:UDP-glucose 4-epimerase
LQLKIYQVGKKKILVAGGTGYIGSHTIVDLIERGYDVVSVDNGINSDTNALIGIKKITGVKVPHYDLDLCDSDALSYVFAQHSDISGVIHFAALKAVGESVEKPIIYFKNNINSLLNILDYCRSGQVEALVFSSSCTVYGDVRHSPVDEHTPLQEAASPYGRTKQIGEQIIVDSVQGTACKSVLLRYFNPAGAHPSGHIGEAPSSAAQNLVPMVMQTAVGQRESMTVFGTDYDTRDGSCIRDYIHVCDLAAAHSLALGRIYEGKQETQNDIFNLGIGEGLTVLEIINAFETQTGVKLNYKLGPRRAGDIQAIYCDNTKARAILGWSPQYNVVDIVKTAWAWEQSRNKK